PRIRTLVEYRRRLAAVLEARTTNVSEAVQNLQAWCREAEASGIRARQEYAARLKGHHLQSLHAGGRGRPRKPHGDRPAFTRSSLRRPAVPRRPAAVPRGTGAGGRSRRLPGADGP